jgi:arylformamidase
MMKEASKQIWDISPLVSASTAVFPGDTQFQREVSLSFEKGDHLGLSAVTTTLHIGAHADAGNHYFAEGKGIDARDLSAYLGPAQVIEVKLPRGARILPQHLNEPVLAKRVLFRTNSFPNPDQWNGDFNSLSPELLHFLADQGVVLAGIDTPSVDPADSKSLESHQALAARNLAVLEGIVLDGVAAGLYELVALPLRWKDADASPVRAILWR